MREKSKNANRPVYGRKRAKQPENGVLPLLHTMENQRTNTTSGIGQLVTQAFDPSTAPVTQTPVDGNTAGWQRNFGKFERLGATYTQVIYRAGKDKLKGYSKPAGMAEKANKQELLINMIERLGRNNYIKEGQRVELWRNFSDEDKDSIKLLTLYGTRFIPEPVVVAEEWLMRFLKNYYNPVVYDYGRELFPTGAADAPEGKALIPDSKKQAPPLPPFDMSRRFTNEDALLRYIDKLGRDGHPRGQIEDFYRQKIQAFHTRSM